MAESTGTPTPRLVACPHCGNAVAWSQANPYRPFCSQRCKLIDLGEWASELMRIRVEGEPDADGESEGEGGEPAA